MYMLRIVLEDCLISVLGRKLPNTWIGRNRLPNIGIRQKMAQNCLILTLGIPILPNVVNCGQGCLIWEMATLSTVHEF